MFSGRRSPWLAVLCAGAICRAGPGAEAGAAPLLAGVALRQAGVMIHAAGATSGDAVRIEVANLTSREQRWIIPPGAVAASEDPQAPDMALRRLKGKSVDPKRYNPVDAIQLAGGETGVYICEAYSLDYSRPNPPKTTDYKLSSPQPFLRCLFELADQSWASTRALQAAVWIHTNKVTLAQLMRQFPVSSEEFTQAQGLVRLAEDRLRAEQAGAPLSARPVQGVSTPTPIPSNAALPDVPDIEEGKQAGQPLMQLQAGAVAYSQAGGQTSVSIPILFHWSAAPSRRPRHCAACLRFESGDQVTGAVAGVMTFQNESGRYDAVIEQGDLRGKGDLVYAVFKDLTAAAQPDLLNSLFDNEKERQRYLISNVLRIPVDWNAQPASAPTPPAPSPSPTPKPVPTPTPTATPRAAPAPPPRPSTAPAGPIEVALPLKNQGVLRGVLIGCENGKLILESRGRRFAYDPKGLQQTPRELLAEAKAARAHGLNATALQYAAVAALLLEDPAEAKALVADCQQALAEGRAKK